MRVFDIQTSVLPAQAPSDLVHQVRRELHHDEVGSVHVEQDVVMAATDGVHDIVLLDAGGTTQMPRVAMNSSFSRVATA